MYLIVNFVPFIVVSCIINKFIFDVLYHSTEGVPDWEDPDLQQEIQAATGVDVTRKSKGKGKGN